MLSILVLIATGPFWDESDTSRGLAIALGGLAFGVTIARLVLDANEIERICRSRLRLRRFLDTGKARTLSDDAWVRKDARRQQLLLYYVLLPCAALFVVLGLALVARAFLK
jgi:hypothetical protein